MDCYRRSRQKKQTLSQNMMRLRGLAPNFKRSKAVFHINTLIVVEMDILIHQLLNLLSSCWFAPVKAFGFECSEEIFHQSIVIRTSASGH